MGEIEESIKTIAEYVKRQMEDVKENTVSRTEFESQVKTLGKLPAVSHLSSVTGLEHRIAKIEEEIKKEGKHETTDITGLEKRLERLEKEMEGKIKAMESVVSKKALHSGKDAVNIHLKRLEELEDRFYNLNKSVSDSSAGLVLSKVRNEIMEKVKNDTDALRTEMNTRLDSAEARVAGSQSEIVSVLGKEIEEIKKTMESMKNDFEDMLETKDLKPYNQLMEDVTDMRKAVDEEISLRGSLEKRIRELREEVEKGAHSEKIMPAAAQKIDISQEIERKIEQEAGKVVVQHLNEFAKTLDKRLPEIATKDDIARLTLRAKSTETVEKRLDSLEQRMNEMLSLLRSYNRSGRHFIVE